MNFYPPLSADSQVQDSELNKEPKLGRPMKVLILDHDSDLADCMTCLIEMWGHEAFDAYDVRTGLDMAARISPDVILIDMDFPGMDGKELARRIRHELHLTRSFLIAFTACCGEEDKNRALDAG